VREQKFRLSLHIPFLLHMSAIFVLQERLDTNRIVKVLDHPARKRIIELLGTRGAMPWKDLATELGTGTGALYYHLDTLEGIVVRDSSKKYSLTKPGQAVYEYMKANPLASPIREASLRLGPRSGPREYLLGIFAPRSLLERMTSSSSRALASLIVLSILSLSAVAYLGDETRLFFLTPARGTLDATGSYLLSLGALVLIGYFATLALFRERTSPLPLAASCALSFLPVIVFSSALFALPSLASLLSSRTVLTVVLVLFQVWGATILAAGISVSSGVRIEKSIMPALVVLYSTMVLVFIQGASF